MLLSIFIEGKLSGLVTISSQQFSIGWSLIDMLILFEADAEAGSHILFNSEVLLRFLVLCVLERVGRLGVELLQVSVACCIFRQVVEWSRWLPSEGGTSSDWACSASGLPDFLACEPFLLLKVVACIFSSGRISGCLATSLPANKDGSFSQTTY